MHRILLAVLIFTLSAFGQSASSPALRTAIDLTMRLPHEYPSSDNITGAYDAGQFIQATSCPPEIGPSEWTRIQANAQKALGWAYMHRRQFADAEKSFVFTLTHLPQGDSETSNWLGLMLLKSTALPSESMVCRPGQEGRCSEALFHMARAALFDGEGALPFDVRKSLEHTLLKTYVRYHGGDDGLTELRALALTSVMPPKDLLITRAHIK
jgi:hypothetical protein